MKGVTPLHIHYGEYLASVDIHEERNVRIINAIKRGLQETEGLAWVRC